MFIDTQLPEINKQDCVQVSDKTKDAIQDETIRLSKSELVEKTIKTNEELLTYKLSNQFGENQSLAVLREKGPALVSQRLSVKSRSTNRILPLKLKTSRKTYTRTGDLGQCSLVSGERTTKNCDQVEATGDVDELNSVLGLLVNALPQKASWLSIEIAQIQESLFQIGALIATNPNSPLFNKINSVSREQVGSLEQSIDFMEEQLPELKNFIIPRGHAGAAQAHFARSVCRRAERHVVKHLNNYNLKDLPESLTILLAYLNRLSDYLFVVGRYCSFLFKSQIEAEH